MIRILRWITLCVAFCAVFTSPASAQQTPPDPYTVAGVRVDQSAANPSVARTQALAQAQKSAFATLVRRLTTPAEQAAIPIPQPDDQTLDRLVRGVDVEEQPRTSGTRYLGRFAVRFDAAGVRTLLQAAGFSVLEARGAPVLIVPVIAQATAPSTPTAVDPWRQAWEQGGYARELLPLAVAPSSVNGAAEWATAQGAAAAVGASSGIFAVARVAGNTLVTDLIEVAPGGVRTNRGQVSAAIQGGDVGVPDAFRRLAEAVNAKLQGEFKSRSVSAQTERAKMSVSALYTDMGEWSRIKEGLGAAGSLISEIRIEAIARDGALVSFMYAGAPTELQEALRRFGLSLADSPQGPVLRAIPR